MWLESEGDGGGAFALGVRRTAIPGIGEQPRWLGNQHLAFEARGTWFDELVGRSCLPIRGDSVAEPVAFGEVAVGQGLPEFFGRGLDIGGVDEFRFTHRASPVASSTR